MNFYFQHVMTSPILQTAYVRDQANITEKLLISDWPVDNNCCLSTYSASDFNTVSTVKCIAYAFQYC